MAHKGLIAWAVLGVLGLVFQATLFYKDSLAAHHPQWQEGLQVFCKWAGCEIAPLQVLDAVLIDHAAIDLIPEEDAPSAGLVLNELQPAPVWRFQLTLRNAQKIPVAMPWVELTLTDLQDQAVMRQVFDPSDLGAPKVLQAGETWSQDLSLRLGHLQVGFLGYRLITFYP